MRKLAKEIMNEEQFWTIIENSDKGKNLERELMKLSEAELFVFKFYWWDYFHAKSYNQALWAVAYTVLSGCGDDGFDYFRFWLVSRGKEVFMAAMKDPDSLVDEFNDLTDDEYPMWEEICYVAYEVFEKKFGKEMDDSDVDVEIDKKELLRPEIKFEWEEDDEESIKKICPRTFEKWWGNDKF